MKRGAAVIALLATLVASCSPRTVDQPRGSLKLTAHFDDAQDLRVGHPVQVSGVAVGTVTNVQLDGYQALVTMSIQGKRRISKAAVAVLTRTSLLGEHIVDLRVPPGVDPATAGFYERGDEVKATRIEPDLEQVTEQSIDFLSVFTANDVADVLDAAVAALADRGPTLHQVVGDLADVVSAMSGQRGSIVNAVDGLGALGAAMASNADATGQLIDDLADVAQVVSADRNKFVAATDQIARLADAANNVLTPNAERVRSLLTSLDGILVAFKDNKATLEGLALSLEKFVVKFPEAIHNGQLLLFGWVVPPLGGNNRSAGGDVFSLLRPPTGAAA